VPSTAQDNELVECEEFEVEAVASWKYTEGQWMYRIKWKDWDKWWRVWAEGIVGSKEPMNK
jgi:hypothetical protein